MQQDARGVADLEPLIVLVSDAVRPHGDTTAQRNHLAADALVVRIELFVADTWDVFRPHAEWDVHGLTPWFYRFTYANLYLCMNLVSHAIFVARVVSCVVDIPLFSVFFHLLACCSRAERNSLSNVGGMFVVDEIRITRAALKHCYFSYVKDRTN